MGKRIVSTGKERDYFDEAKRNLQAQREYLLDIDFYYSDYSLINVPKGSLVYCDIPYNQTKKYSTSKNFNYDEFWNWAREISKTNILIISEQNAPDDFKVIWEQEVKRTINNTKRTTVTEKLFMIK